MRSVWILSLEVVFEITCVWLLFAWIRCLDPVVWMLSVWVPFVWVRSVWMLAVWMEGSGCFCFLSHRSLAFGFVALRFPFTCAIRGLSLRAALAVLVGCAHLT